MKNVEEPKHSAEKEIKGKKLDSCKQWSSEKRLGNFFRIIGNFNSLGAWQILPRYGPILKILDLEKRSSSFLNAKIRNIDHLNENLLIETVSLL